MTIKYKTLKIMEIDVDTLNDSDRIYTEDELLYIDKEDDLDDVLADLADDGCSEEFIGLITTVYTANYDAVIICTAM